MDVAVDSCLLGSSKHLLVSNGTVQWISKIPADTWHFSGELKGSARCWDTVLKLSGIENRPPLPQKYVNMMKVVAPDQLNIPWPSVLPQDAYRKYFDLVLEFAQKIPNEISVLYYDKIWRFGDLLLSSLRPTKVDNALIEKFASESVHSSSTIDTFRPRAGGFAYPIKYTRFGTVTGRLIVEDGPNILHLKKNHRSIIKSSFSNGKIVFLDFAALEARILLYESGGACDEADLYTSIGSKLGGIPRNIVKGAILADLYGSSKNSLALSLGLSDTKLSEFIKKIEEVIDTKALLSKLRSQFKERGYIHNKYGRRIEVARPQDNIFINYYAQSTGVDVSLVGFSRVLDKLGPDGIRPLFVLHDALVLDVREDKIDEVRSIQRVSVPGYKQNFYLNSEIL